MLQAVQPLICKEYPDRFAADHLKRTTFVDVSSAFIYHVLKIPEGRERIARVPAARFRAFRFELISYQ
jgi:hypothetical protein